MSRVAPRRRAKATLVPLLLGLVGALVVLAVLAPVSMDAVPADAPRRPPAGSARAVLRRVPDGIWQTWRGRRFLVVLGVPSVDSPPHRRRRDLQRASWLRYAGVATRANNFTGEMLVLFVLGRHFAQGYVYSPAVREEATRSQDVLTLAMNDGRPTTQKRIGGSGHWGLAAEVGTSRKSMTWYTIALRLFPHADYIAKADDDVFVRVPQFLADLHALPRRGVYWGRVMRWLPEKGNRRKVFYFVGGMCITMARDVVEAITAFKPLQRLLDSPLDSSGTAEAARFSSLNAEHEDVMLGRALYEMRQPNITFVIEKTCRFHDVHAGSNRAPVTSRSVVVHHLREAEYALLALRFTNESADTVKPVAFRRRSGPLGKVGQAQYSYDC
ncbi:UDP-Gal or UDP-GlcNAc-dependent glycosyltransferase [Trypanosoma conorhini]|uniref:Hexosyltransferase n=1 Tax=Trypanosoma conorhini TaxID=83891 RepID=A0A3R7PJC1_9TRYP|nr:UDP-Gal or UDP-GlcNAc-dependent glycosyltransferase [Trypanosoma conorhini]RNF20832.1 UDP-Gal or UDP-GlcNAc-dependent glycosyltransferase [Trypanosoma conorhini]